MRTRIGAVEAIIVDTVRPRPGALMGLGDFTDTGTQLLDTVTGGQFTVVNDKLDSISLGLKLSILGSVVSGGLAVAALFRMASGGGHRINPGRRRRRRRFF